MQRRGLLVGNWKMNGLIESAQELVAAVRAGVEEREERRLVPEVVICPPFTALYPVHQWLSGSSVKLGAQNLSAGPPGPLTGEVNGILLRNVGCRYVILGHSERRQRFGESDSLVAAKVTAAIRDNLVPIVCMGEEASERDEGRTLEILDRQLRAVLEWEGLRGQLCSKKRCLVVAYEPIWAIGTGRSASVEQVSEVHGFIRRMLTEFVGRELADKIRIVYGGSVRPDNAEGLFAAKDVDGGLVGGASLNGQDFLAILDAFGRG